MANAEEQEMEIEALEAILMDDFKEVDGQSAEGLGTEHRCFRIVVSPKDNEDDEEPTEIPLRLGLLFAHTPNYPDEAPLLQVRSIRGIRNDELASLQAQLEEEVQENLGMSMIFTLATSCKEWLRQKVNPDGDAGASGLSEVELKKLEEEAEEKRVKEARAAGVPVTVENFNAWREKFDAEAALERAKRPGAAEEYARKQRMTGRKFFESGLHRGAKKAGEEGEGGEEEEFDFDDDEDEDFLDDLLGEEEGEGGGAGGEDE